MAECEVPASELDGVTLSLLRKLPIRETFVNTNIEDSDGIVIGSAEVTVTLPTAIGRDGCWFVIKRKQESAVTIDTVGSETIDGSDFLVLNYASYGKWPTINVFSDGENWMTF